MSVRKREWTSPAGEQKSAWVCDYVDGSGKRRLKTFKLKKQADQFAATASVEVRQGTHVADSASATIEEAGKLWIKATTANGLEQSSIADYNRTLRLHINPLIGSLRLTALTVTRLRSFEDDLRAGGRSLATTKRTLVTPGTLLADAQERGLVARNVVRDMRAKRGGGERRHEMRHKGRLRIGVDIPLPREIKALLGAATGRWRPFLLVAVLCGLRASELRGLRWADVDMKRGQIHVRQRADRFNDIGPPKSISGERTLPAPPVVI
ncbi:tyrosine-type recombinase/integrase, partial [Aureimonas sp. D3]|uniref:tyrosine-type recombinase/integrase n=1 Tax=Aureimonas sp. D3 TaxID=1638164 RepID=UPI000AEF6658